MDQLIFAFLSHTHHWYEVGMLKVPAVRTRFSLSGVENEEADTGREGRTRPARPDSQARTGTGKYSFSLFS